MQGLTLPAITAAEKHTSLHRTMTNPLERKKEVNVTGLQCVLQPEFSFFLKFKIVTPL